jgi:hypothetical protein
VGRGVADPFAELANPANSGASSSDTANTTHWYTSPRPVEPTGPINPAPGFRSASWRQIAADSNIVAPSPSWSAWTRPSGWRSRCSSDRLSAPLISVNSYGAPISSSNHSTRLDPGPRHVIEPRYRHLQKPTGGATLPGNRAIVGIIGGCRERGPCCPAGVTVNGGQGIDMVARLRAGGSVSSRAGAADFPIVGLEQQSHYIGRRGHRLDGGSGLVLRRGVAVDCPNEIALTVASESYRRRIPCSGRFSG